MPITTQTIDSSGEILHLRGLDISDFLEGRAWLNWEHNNDLAENLVGRFTFAKKIFGPEDCDDERQAMYWAKLQTPFLYGICDLLDEEYHPGAVAVAAMIRYFKKRSEPVMVGASIEGQTLDRKDGDLLRTVGRRVAATLRPCNRQCWVDFMGEGPASDKFVKASLDSSPLVRVVEVDSAIFADSFADDPYSQLKKALSDLNKTLTAGSYNVAPGSLVGGAALQVEDSGLKNRAKAAYRDWDRRRPLKEVLKAAMPEVSDSYIDHFVDLAHDLSLRKGQPVNLLRVGREHAHGQHDEDQSKLIEGLYWDQGRPINPGHDQHGGEFRLLRNDAGRDVFAKIDPQSDQNDAHHQSQAYYRMAKDFFGMGDHVPVTAAFRHPDVHHKPVIAQEFLSGMKTPFTHVGEFVKAAKRAREDGSLHKLSLMDQIVGVADRHGGNVMVDDGKVKHIDNDFSFLDEGHEPFYHRPFSGFQGIGQDTLHADAMSWLRSLNPRELVRQAVSHGIHRVTASGMAKRLMALQSMAPGGATMDQMAGQLKGTRLSA